METIKGWTLIKRGFDLHLYRRDGVLIYAGKPSWEAIEAVFEDIAPWLVPDLHRWLSAADVFGPAWPMFNENAPMYAVVTSPPRSTLRS